MREVVAMILAGGRGDRLSVLTKHRPTSAVPFGGKYRIIDFSLSNLAHSDIYRVGILTQYAPVSLNRHVGIGRPWDFDRREGGVKLLQPYVRSQGSNWYAGTADALLQNLNLLEHSGSRYTLVLSGDEVYTMDYGPLLEQHVRSGARLSLVVGRRDARLDTRRVGMVEVEGQRITRFVEKPDSSDMPHVFLGIYVFNTRHLIELLKSDPAPTHLVYDIVMPQLAAGETIGAYEYEGYWQDVGSVDTYYAASMSLLGRHPRLPLSNPDWLVYSPSEERPPAKFCRGARVQQSLVSHGSRIWGTVINSVLSPGVVVEEGAVVSDSIIMHDAVIHRRAMVDRAIIDKNVVIGEAAAIGAGEIPSTRVMPWAAPGVTIIGKNAVVPPKATVGRESILDTDIGAAVFAANGGVIEPGSYVTADAITLLGAEGGAR